jgi:hypothetical protein
MRPLTIIGLIFLFGCKQKAVDTKTLAKGIWVNADIKFETLHFDTTAYFVHGSGTLLFFDTTNFFKSLSNDFYLVNDTIGWGEPLANFKSGRWAQDLDKIISTYTYIEGSARELSGKIQIDTFTIIGDTLIRNEKDKYIRAKLLTQELTDIFKKDWPKY